MAAPRHRDALTKHRLMRYGRVVEDEFIVPDGGLDEELFGFRDHLDFRVDSEQQHDDQRFKINWHSIFRQIFMKEQSDFNQQTMKSDSIKTIGELMENILTSIAIGKERKSIAMTTL